MVSYTTAGSTDLCFPLGEVIPIGKLNKLAAIKTCRPHTRSCWSILVHLALKVHHRLFVLNLQSSAMLGVLPPEHGKG